MNLILHEIGPVLERLLFLRKETETFLPLHFLCLVLYSSFSDHFSPLLASSFLHMTMKEELKREKLHLFHRHIPSSSSLPSAWLETLFSSSLSSFSKMSLVFISSSLHLPFSCLVAFLLLPCFRMNVTLRKEIFFRHFTLFPFTSRFNVSVSVCQGNQFFSSL